MTDQLCVDGDTEPLCGHEDTHPPQASGPGAAQLMSEESVRPRSIEIDRYPGPVCGYVIEDGRATVTVTNDAFASRFGADLAGESVASALEACGLRVCGEAPPLASCLAGGDRFCVRRVDPAASVHAEAPGTDPTEYVVQVRTPGTATPGYLFFTPTSNADEASTRDTRSGTLGIDHVASVVSHDLRNPLDVAKARLQAGRELEEPHHFEHVERAHERMERIIQDVLTLARGEEVIDPDETVDLTTVATAAWETVETNGAALLTDDALPTVTADPDRVSRLFENLFRNAIEHGETSETRESDRAVTVTIGPLEDDQGFYVADDGPGISPPDRARVFEPGYTTDDHGTGLGLAIVEEIVDLHGWSIRVTDSRNGGAQIEVTGIASP